MRTNGLPSLTALLGLLAIAGYQNRDKLSELLNGSGSQARGMNTNDPSRPQGHSPDTGLGDLLSGVGGEGSGGLGGLLSGLGTGGLGGLLSGGIGELIDRLKQNGRGDLAESWVGTGPNKAVEHIDIEKAVGPDVLTTLSEQTGLSRDEIAKRLATVLPEAVDGYTPDGKLPTI